MAHFQSLQTNGDTQNHGFEPQPAKSKFTTGKMDGDVEWPRTKGQVATNLFSFQHSLIAALDALHRKEGEDDGEQDTRLISIELAITEIKQELKVEIELSRTRDNIE